MYAPNILQRMNDNMLNIKQEIIKIQPIKILNK